MVAPRCTEFYRYGKQYMRALQKGLLLEKTHIKSIIPVIIAPKFDHLYGLLRHRCWLTAGH